MKLLSKYMAMHLKAELEYKLSFFLSFLSQFLLVAAEGFIVLSLFNSFGLLKDFNQNEVMISFCVIHLGFSLVETFGRGFDQFQELIISGKFDLLLIRPKNIFLQVIGSNIAYQKASKILLLIGFLIYFLIKLSFPLTIFNSFILLLMIMGSFIIFLSIHIIKAALCFFTIDSLEIMNIFSYGAKQFGQYPVSIYRKELFYFFTFFIPLSCINYFPLLFILGKTNNILYAMMPFFTLVLLIISIIFFHFGLMKYKSTGS